MTGTRSFRNIMKSVYELMLKAVKMTTGLQHLFEDVDTKSTTSIRSEKEKRLDSGRN